MKHYSLFLFLFSCIACKNGLAQIRNISAGLWSDSAIWENNKVPADSSIVILGYDVTIDSSASCLFLNTNGKNVTVNQGVTMNVTGTNLYVMDFDNNLYDVVLIGTQLWMKSNLRTTHYNDGTPIPYVPDSTAWVNLEATTTGAYSHYNNDSANINIYGRLYNGYVLHNAHGICPRGWHIPSDNEWNDLLAFLGGAAVAGDKMKEAGNGHWVYSPNSAASNSSNFTALPAGIRYNGGYYLLGTGAFFWSSTNYFDNDIGSGVCYMYNTDSSAVVQIAGKAIGYSCRCIKD